MFSDPITDKKKKDLVVETFLEGGLFATEKLLDYSVCRSGGSAVDKE